MKGMKQTEGLKHREFFDEYKACNQNTFSRTAVMSDIVHIGDYELLEMQNEGYETN